MHPEDRDHAQAYHENLLRGTGQGEAEFRIIWPDGSVHWIVSKAKMHLNAHGEPARVIGINLDVTRLREAEQVRRESEQRYSDLFRTMNQAVDYLDGEGLIISANPAADKLFGLSLAEMPGRHRSELRHFRATREDGTPISPGELPSMVALRTGSEVHDVILRVWNAQTGEPHWVSIDAMPRFRAGETKPYEVQVICHDLTAQVEAAARLSDSEERFRLSDQT